MAASATLALQLTGSSEADARPTPTPAAQLVSAKRVRAAHPYDTPCQTAKTEADLLLVSEDVSTLAGLQRAARHSIGINAGLLVALRRTKKSGTLSGDPLAPRREHPEDDRKNVGLLRPGADQQEAAAVARAQRARERPAARSREPLPRTAVRGLLRNVTYGLRGGRWMKPPASVSASFFRTAAQLTERDRTSRITPRNAA